MDYMRFETKALLESQESEINKGDCTESDVKNIVYDSIFERNVLFGKKTVHNDTSDSA
jgi:hypothetical protein